MASGRGAFLLPPTWRSETGTSSLPKQASPQSALEKQATQVRLKRLNRASDFIAKEVRSQVSWGAPGQLPLP
eukprot:CAMPEP_0197652064 /NCGR_PEP_ID=MMETSP1338-20131121/34223_1 /TAXON_ID=43686 ORGANISM="Pelagodinium beii, Strain RCC1491" /NCGR_SAMPLE_ID=MMETSP1338 /ASSEMBLY_ACC=CAM_ASM_000754 /LENGTH=71 /DNA_ID=CAMNT_0043226859 /DNA_START=260 /DNA_END=471 /DNA_ORIENTATION=-